MAYKHLFSPIKIRGLQLKNRVMLPAMGTKFANQDRTVSQQLIDYHVARAEGGCGLSMVEVASVHCLSAPRNFVAVCDDKYIPGLKRLTDAIHKAGGKAGLQLWQGGIAASFDEACQMFVPSDMPLSETLTLPAMTTAEIEEVVRCYSAAAQRSVQAGFDCVEVHAAHNYLIHTFLSPYFNRRTDEYGGSFENRARFPLAVLRAVRAAIPQDMPLFMRIGAHDDFLEGGLAIEDVIAFCKLAKEAGVDVLDVSRGNIVTAGIQYEVPPVDLPRGFNIENAAQIRAATGLFTIGVGRINDPQQAEDILAADKVDMVVIGRGQLADAEFCNKAKEGRADDIVRCIGCNQGCYDGFSSKESPHITCLRNPAVGREADYALLPAKSPKTVLIAGGGPAGLEAAITLKKRGHNPVLYEAAAVLGGQFLLAGEAPRKIEMKEAAIHMGAQATALGVEIHLNTPVTPALIEKIKPDAVLCAIGSEPMLLDIPGKNLSFVCDSYDVLDGRTQPKGRVVVIGGGLVGLECAEYLKEKGCDVAVLEMLPEMGADLGDTRKAAVMGSLVSNGIEMYTNAKCTGIQKGAVLAEVQGEARELPCDWAVIAVGAVARDSSALEKTCRKRHIPWFVVGDAAKARRALNATAEAAAFARTFDAPQAMERAAHSKKVIFLTGATGTMGKEVMRQILERDDRFYLRILVRPSQKNRTLLKNHMSLPALEVVWGDLTSYDDVLQCVNGADYVLHVGAFISPEADKYPLESIQINLGSTLHILRAIKAQPNPDAVRLACIGTVAETGCRMPPIHWGRCGDPIKGSIFDYYAVAKIAAERAVIESGLKYWVSLRQTGILPTAGGEDPITLHQPIANQLEFVTAMDSGRLMANVCEDWVPESFWKKIYNIGGGESYRLNFIDNFSAQVKPFGFGLQDVFEPNWFPRFNFHGQWYTDADALEEILHFRGIDFPTYMAAAQAEMQAMFQNPLAAPYKPTAAMMKATNEKLAHQERGTLWMLEPEQQDWMFAFFGSRARVAALPKSWQDVDLTPPSSIPTYLNHGYNEEKPVEKLDAGDLKGAAEFRGGQYLSAKAEGFYQPARWRCAFGHEFEASANLVLKGGHWCPECERLSWNYGETAKRSPFFNQVWGPLHDADETYEIKKTMNDRSV